VSIPAHFASILLLHQPTSGTLRRNQRVARAASVGWAMAQAAQAVAHAAKAARGLWTSRGFGWRIHCGVEVTESSTNKQNTLSPVPWVRERRHRRSRRLSRLLGLSLCVFC
jgi:hypothetical protein